MDFNNFANEHPRGELMRGIQCKACQRPISSDPELCPECLQIARALIRDIDMPDIEDDIIIEVLDYAPAEVS